MVILSFIERCVGFLEDKFSEDIDYHPFSHTNIAIIG